MFEADESGLHFYYLVVRSLIAGGLSTPFRDASAGVIVLFAVVPCKKTTAPLPKSGKHYYFETLNRSSRSTAWRYFTGDY
jgi:hypothetical protein